jgi:hypothetical protein
MPRVLMRIGELTFGSIYLSPTTLLCPIRDYKAFDALLSDHKDVFMAAFVRRLLVFSNTKILCDLLEFVAKISVATINGFSTRMNGQFSKSMLINIVSGHVPGSPIVSMTSLT